MTRLAVSFITAIVCHSLFFFFTTIDGKVYAPEVVSKKQISISLKQSDMARADTVHPPEKHTIPPILQTKETPIKKTSRVQAACKRNLYSHQS